MKNNARRLVVEIEGKVVGVIREQDLFFEMEKILCLSLPRFLLDDGRSYLKSATTSRGGSRSLPGAILIPSALLEVAD